MQAGENGGQRGPLPGTWGAPPLRGISGGLNAATPALPTGPSPAPALPPSGPPAHPLVDRTAAEVPGVGLQLMRREGSSPTSPLWHAHMSRVCSGSGLGTHAGSWGGQGHSTAPAPTFRVVMLQAIGAQVCAVAYVAGAAPDHEPTWWHKELGVPEGLLYRFTMPCEIHGRMIGCIHLRLEHTHV